MRSTAEARRVTVLNAAVSVFARAGFHATPVTAVAAAAGISEAYVFRLFSGKLGLFVAAAGACFDRIADAIEAGAERAGGDSPEEILDAMGGAYAELIADRDLLLFQVQAQAVTDIPEIAEAVRAGYRRVATFVQSRSQAERRAGAAVLRVRPVVPPDRDRRPGAGPGALGSRPDGRHPPPLTDPDVGPLRRPNLLGH